MHFQYIYIVVELYILSLVRAQVIHVDVKLLVKIEIGVSI